MRSDPKDYHCLCHHVFSGLDSTSALNVLNVLHRLATTVIMQASLPMYMGYQFHLVLFFENSKSYTYRHTGTLPCYCHIRTICHWMFFTSYSMDARSCWQFISQVSAFWISSLLCSWWPEVVVYTTGQDMACLISSSRSTWKYLNTWVNPGDKFGVNTWSFVVRILESRRERVGKDHIKYY